MDQSFRVLATSVKGPTLVKAPRSENRRNEKFKFGHWVWEKAVSSPSGAKLSLA